MEYKDNGIYHPISQVEVLSKRDWFAGMALQGYLSRFADVNGRLSYTKEAVRCSFILADAMIEESKK